MEERIKCYFCGMEELSLRANVQALEIENTRLQLEVERLNKLLSKARREFNQFERTKQLNLELGGG